MAVPKKKVSKSKRDKRRTFDKMIPKIVSLCNVCSQFKLPHNMCKSCGHYKGRSYLSSDKQEK